MLVAWKWDTESDADEFARALRYAVRIGLGGRPHARLPGWNLRGGGVAIQTGPDATTLSLAPSVKLAAEAARLVHR